VVTFIVNGFLLVMGGPGCKFEKYYGSWAGYELDLTDYGQFGL